MNWPAEFDHVFSLLEKVTYSPARDRYSAACPAHEDNRPSLDLLIDGDNLIPKCHGPGCSFSEIKSALSSKSGRKVFFRAWNGGRDCGKKRSFSRGSGFVLETTYDYTDEHGNLEFQVCRGKDPATGKKRFWQRAPDPGQPGGWTLSIEGRRRHLFNLPALHENARRPPEARRPVFIVEGEKDALNLGQVGVLATTNSGGAGKFHLSEWQILTGMKVVIIPDIDPIDKKTGRRPGWDHAMQVGDILHGHAEAVRILLLPVQEGQDVTDWLASLPDDLGPEGKKLQLWGLVRRAPEFDRLRMGAPIPRFVLCQMEALANPATVQPVRSIAEGIGDIDLWLHALKADVGAARAKGQKPDTILVLSRLAQIAAACQKTAEDLRLFPAPAVDAERTAR